MNEIVKQNIKTRLEAALSKECLTTVSAGRKLGVKDNYLSMVKNPKTWVGCMYAWDALLKWVNSGQSIVEYSEKHGHVLPEKKESVSEPAKNETEPSVIVPKIEDFSSYPRIKIKPGVLERRQKEIEHKRMSNGELIDALLKEKALLREKIDAIDVLLKHYIS
jgi:hypothetical protein